MTSSDPCILCKTKEDYPRCRKTCSTIIRIEEKRKHDMEVAKAEKERENPYNFYKSERMRATGKAIER